MPIAIFVLVTLSIITFSFPAAAAKLYKWVDENGRTHYSQTPPANQQQQKFEVSSLKQSKTGEHQCCLEVRDLSAEIAQEMRQGATLLQIHKLFPIRSYPKVAEIANFVSSKHALKLDVLTISKMSYDACMAANLQACRAGASAAGHRSGGSGTGFLIAEGLILTNHHVINQCRRITVGESEWNAGVIAKDNVHDLALLKSEIPAQVYATFRDRDSVDLGEDVVVIGYPLQGVLSSQLNLTSGNVSALAGISNDQNVFQLTAPIQPGNSGGPVLDESGHVIGVIVSKVNEIIALRSTGSLTQNVNFAIQPVLVQSFLEKHSIDYRRAPSVSQKEMKDITRDAQQYTVPIVCQR